VLDAVTPSLLLGAREGHLAGRSVAVALRVGGGISHDELARDVDGTSEFLNSEDLARGVVNGERAASANGERELTTNSGALWGVVPPAVQIGDSAGAVGGLGAATLETSIAVSSSIASPLATGSLSRLGLNAGGSVVVGNVAIDAIANLLALGLAPEAALGIGAGKLALIRGLVIGAGHSHGNGDEAGEESKDGLHCTK